MKRIILIVENVAEEQEKAKQAAIKAGTTPVLAATLEDFDRIFESLKGKISGVITDLHFPENEKLVARKGEAEKPNGLAVVATAVENSLAIVVCSDIDHHYAAYLKRVMRMMEKSASFPIPFTMDSKDWDWSCSQLKTILK
jgi:hypothetical protein